MDSEDVLFLGVETDNECVCLGKRKVMDKGKCSANPSKRRVKKKPSTVSDNCLVIVDSGEGDYIEVYGGTKESKDDCLSRVDSAASDKDILECAVIPQLGLKASAGNGLVKSNEAAAAAMNVPPATLVAAPPATNTLQQQQAPITTDDPHYHRHQVAGGNPHPHPLSNNNPLPPLPHPPPPPPPSAPTTVAAPSCRYQGNSNTDLTKLERTPTCWTNCPNCPPNKKRKYHLIDVAYNCPEWGVVSNPLTQAGFVVNKVQRIQNETLWQRLCYEKKLMLRDRVDVNEQLLYHTSRSTISIICEEGLDLRLSRNGMFGSGIYFSDSPVKCNCYWGDGMSPTRYMFCCRVLLGEIKEYPRGKSEQLVREPPKPNPKPGEPKCYDSVMGNLSGQKEYVVYNAYRVMPEYVLNYSVPSAVMQQQQQQQPGAMSYPYPSLVMARSIIRKKPKRRGRKKY